MEVNALNEQKNASQKLMEAIVKNVDEIIGAINLYVPNRHGSIAITRLEEAAMWINVMINSYQLKADAPQQEDFSEEQVVSAA